jgi:F-type H+-transporting ATPase subunit b
MNLNATLIIEVVSFIILWAILAKLFFKPLLKILDQRKEAVRGWLDEAKKDRSDAQEFLSQAKRELSSAKDEAINIKQTSRIESEKLRKKILEEAKRESRNLIEQSKEEIELKIQEAKKELRNDIANISLALTEKILEREINKKDHQHLIEESIKEISGD